MTYLRIPAKTLPRRWSWNPGQRDLHRASQQAAAGGLRLSGHQMLKKTCSWFWPPETTSCCGMDELLRSPRDPNQKDEKGYTPLLHAALEGDLGPVWLLIEAGADIDARNTELGGMGPNALGSYEWDIIIWSDSWWNIAPIISQGQRVVWRPCICSQSGPLRRCWGWNPLFLFSHWIPFVNPESTGNVFYFWLFLWPLSKSKVVQLLLSVEPTWDLPMADDGSTALHLASSEGYVDIVRVLLEARADKDQATTDGLRTPLHFAAQHGHVDTVRLLFEAGVKKGT